MARLIFCSDKARTYVQAQTKVFSYAAGIYYIVANHYILCFADICITIYNMKCFHDNYNKKNSGDRPLFMFSSFLMLPVGSGYDTSIRYFILAWHSLYTTTSSCLNVHPLPPKAQRQSAPGHFSSSW